jgi:hypothetical protein
MWKDIKHYEGVYEASSEGMVRRKTTMKVLAIARQCGYASVHLCKDGIRRRVALHRIVAETFVPGYFLGAVVNHIDGNPKNNRADNLEWCTQKQNIRHSFDVLNRRNSHAKYVLNVAYGIFYPTILEASKTTNYSYQSVRFKLSGKWPNNTNLVII